MTTNGHSDQDDGRGCLLILGVFLVFMGSGVAFGWSISCLITGVLLVALVLFTVPTRK